jgi:hypothetical protein
MALKKVGEWALIPKHQYDQSCEANEYLNNNLYYISSFSDGLFECSYLLNNFYFQFNKKRRYITPDYTVKGAKEEDIESGLSFAEIVDGIDD